MADSLLQKIGSTISGFFNGGSKEPEVRERIYDKEPAQQEASRKVETNGIDFGDLQNYTVENTKGLSPADLIALPEQHSQVVTPSSDAGKKLQADMESGLRDGDFAVKATKHSAARSLVEDIKRKENPNEKGLIKTSDGKEFFMPFDSSEGRGPDKGNSIKEIGYGTKIMESWLSDDKSKWPLLDGVSIDVRKGITRDQAEGFAQQSLNSAFSAAKAKVAGFPEATEMQKKYWVDLAYNGGNNVFEKNPNAMKALKSGYPIEGIIRTLDYIKSAGKVSRGLLNRRLSSYNEAALEHTGVPVITEYSFGPEIKVKFGTKFLTNKVSKSLASKINDAGGWFTISKGGDDTKTRKVGDNFKFEE